MLAPPRKVIAPPGGRAPQFEKHWVNNKISSKCCRHDQTGFGGILRVQKSMQLPHIAKVDLVKQQVVYPEPVVEQPWTTRFSLAIDRANNQAKEAIQFDGSRTLKH
ncbi:hypothetical protein TNCV_2105871 [Trichonephila clavipes]|nr:hypothetical protein TNCV_2105871 [Trichonephila clavipes]